MSAPALSSLIGPLLLLGVFGCSKPAEKLFEVSTDGSTRSGMLQVTDGVVVVNEAGFITRVQADGTTRWRVPMGRELASRAVEARGVVVATSTAGEWFGILASNGSVPWEIPRQPITRADLVTDGARVYAVLNDGAVRCIDGATGAVLWSRPAPGAAGKVPIASPIIAASSVIVALGEAGLMALAWEDGAPRWKSELAALAMTPSTDGRTIFVNSPDRTLRQVDANTGEVRWKRTFDADLTSGPRLAGELLYVGLGAQLVGVDPATGETRWSATVPDPVSPVALAGRTLLVPTSGREGRVYLFAPPATKPYASLRIDSPVRAAPVILGDKVLILASDGRVLGYRLKAPPANRE